MVILLMFMVIISVNGGPAAYAACQAACAAGCATTGPGFVACYAACQSACAATFLVPEPWCTIL